MWQKNTLHLLSIGFDSKYIAFFYFYECIIYENSDFQCKYLQSTFTRTAGFPGNENLG